VKRTRPQRPLILISPDIDSKGKEFGDLSTSLSGHYQQAVMSGGGLPLILPITTSPDLIGEMISRCDGLLLTGGDDIEPRLYTHHLPAKLRATVDVTADGGARDLRELLLINEVFRQRKPLLAICRGHQMLNVALGGTLIPDLPSRKPRSVNHRRDDKRSEAVHEVRLTPGSLLAKITATQKLSVNSTHHQAVGKVAAPLCVSACGPDGVIEALELKAGVAGLPFLLSVQFHPERLADRYRAHAAIFAAFTQACALSREDNL
jgi:putative glutamine amidotransferase